MFGISGDLEFEIDKEKFTSRRNTGLPDSVVNSSTLSKKIAPTIQPIVAMRRVVSLKPEEDKKLYLINACGETKEEAENNLNEYIKSERLNCVFDLAKANSEAETRYLGIKGKDISVYQNMLEQLLYPESKNEGLELDLSNEQIWKYGISGDNPILLVKIKDENDMFLLNEISKAKEYFDTKNIYIDVVVLAEEKVECNFKVLCKIPWEDKRVLEARASLVLNAKYGSLNVQIKPREEEKYTEEAVEELPEVQKPKDLVFYNGIGGFSSNGKEYQFCGKPGTVWSNIMANEKFGTLVTDTFGGYTWYENCRMNRISDFSNDAFLDLPSERIYIETENAKWRVGANWAVTYGLGYSIYETEGYDLEQKVAVYVPVEDSLKQIVLKLKNKSLEKKKIKIIYEVDFVLGENKDRFVNYVLKEKLNMLFAKNSLNPGYYAYIFSNEKMKLEDRKIVINLEIDSLETKEIRLILGAEKTEIECIEIGNKHIGKEQEELEKVKEYWEKLTSKVEAQTPMAEFNIMQNGWLVYQTMCSRMLAKTGFYQSGGAVGYRDQLQDAMGMKYVDSKILRNQILVQANHQFVEGDVLHWWHENVNLGVRTRCSDDLLWLAYAVIDYVEFTGDYSILEEEVNYLQGEKLKENEKDRMDHYLESNIKGTVYEHCMKAIEKVLDFEVFPKINGGDWNDGMNEIGGESIWLGFFLYSILVKFAEISKYVTRFANKETAIALNAENESTDVKCIDTDEKTDDYEKLMGIEEKLKKSLNTIGWDGRWFKRVILEDGRALGSVNNKECKIDGIVQSWATISEAGDNDKKYIAMESFENMLVDKENGIIKLLTPGFNREEFEPGYIAAYQVGIRENGGQYTHGAIWAIIAMIKLGLKEKAMELYKMINPINHAKTEEQVAKYKVEPYVMAADIYTADEMTGRGGWTWYTGSSGWMYILQTEYILGLKIKHNVLKIEPCVPDDWEEFSVKFKWKNAVYNIEYKKTAVPKLWLNGEVVEEIKLQETGEYDVKVEF